MVYSGWKKIITVGVVASIIASTLTVICTSRNYNKYVEENNAAILRLVSLLLEEKEIEPEIIIQYLEESEIVEDRGQVDKKILAEYGYYVDTKYFLDKNEKNLQANIRNNLMVVNGLLVAVMVLCYWYQKRREQQIHQLIAYLQELQEKEYTLKIQENEEGELSKLQNEIYKIMILLKEQAENSLLDKQLVKNNIVDISHQLKTPLTSMSIMLDNLVEYPEMDEETRSMFLQNMRERVIHMELLVQNLLKLSRFDANVVEFRNERIDVQKLIENAVEKNAILLKQKCIDFAISGDEKIELFCDLNWQSEAISNIIKNAIEHSEMGGKIEVVFSANNFATIIKVKDYGTGIKKESLKKIFTRFYKESDANEHSLGVGLNLAKTIVEKNNGSIMVRSKENEGTTFEIRYMQSY